MKRALISVSDKTGIVDLAKGLVERGWEIISTGGTLATLQQAGVPVMAVEAVTRFPEMLDGRVKTLHPHIHGGILARRDLKSHVAAVQEHGIEFIDMVVVNLYPFAETIAKAETTLSEAIEQIDIGGPSLLRAAAKNWQHVWVLTAADQYQEVLTLLDRGGDSSADRLKYAQRVFAHTAAYDAQIARYLSGKTENTSTDSRFPQTWQVEATKVCDLRYGENPHQSAAFYRDSQESGGIANARQLNGKELSFNNLVDADAAWSLVSLLTLHSCAIIKHTNPCGVASGESTAEAFRKALAADDVSAFGGIVACNTEVDLAAAEAMRPIFFEIIMAPSFTPEALALLSEKKNLRLLEVKPSHADRVQAKHISGGWVLQDADELVDEEADWKVVTKRQPTEEEMRALRFGWNVVRYVKSNAIVVNDEETTLGIGAGQMNRVGAAKIALEQAGEKAHGAVLASDAFFPFGDTVETAAAAGITAIIQPGGSVRDAESIEAADKYGIAMVVTGRRHFRHG